jgi:hypothetical protein
MEERVADAALVDDDSPKAGLLGLDCASQAGGAGAYYQEVEDFVLSCV